MLQQALRKLQAEIAAADPDDSYVSVVGAYMMDRVRSHPEEAAKVMADGKTIAGSLQAMQAEARKKRKGNFAMLTPEQGFAVVLGYYGIEVEKPTGMKAIDFDVGIEDILGV